MPIRHLPNAPEITVEGDLSDQAIEALARLLIELVEAERPDN